MIFMLLEIMIQNNENIIKHETCLKKLKLLHFCEFHKTPSETPQISHL